MLTPLGVEHIRVDPRPAAELELAAFSEHPVRQPPVATLGIPGDLGLDLVL
jgi:hypothetical protein